MTAVSTLAATAAAANDVTGYNNTVLNGALLVALPVALLGGLVSFFSPCVLPLVPGYLSYVTGVTGTDLGEARRGRMVAGASLFVLGFTSVFVSSGALMGYAGSTLLDHQAVLSKVLGAFMILMGVFFMGLMPWLTQREFRFHRRPMAGLIGAPVLGVLFGIGWTPCIGPTLASVLMLSSEQGDTGRGAILMVAYCVGLGVPFVLAAVAFRKALGAFGWVKRHYVWVIRIGGTMMIVTGLLLLTGAWDSIMQDLRTWSSGFSVGV
ncbi:cytochrome c biogenesis protein CcdA [Streptomyces sp. NPDC047022]|uniref:cytochrome c biogenesis CcdA family protein n=1 Tax=Streptomyces sp. NPDC047022 TaxID=3155737 RepID=UPI0033FEBC93